jgi:hypothetical protein
MQGPINKKNNLRIFILKKTEEPQVTISFSKENSYFKDSSLEDSQTDKLEDINTPKFIASQSQPYSIEDSIEENIDEHFNENNHIGDVKVFCYRNIQNGSIFTPFQREGYTKCRLMSISQDDQNKTRCVNNGVICGCLVF